MRSTSFIHVVMLAVAGAGCVPELDDDVSLVGDARVLAIVAEPPEAREGETVRLGVLVAGSADPGVQPLLSFCHARKPLSELGPVAPECLQEGSPELEPLGRGQSVAGVIERDACSVFGPRRPTAEAGQPAGRPVDPDSTGGFYQPVLATLPGQPSSLGGVRLDCGLPGADRDQVIDYNERHRPNRNPVLSSVEVFRDGAYVALAEATPLAVGVGSSVELRAVWDDCADGTEGTTPVEECGGAETFVMLDPEAFGIVERTELLIASWYATAGAFAEPRTGPDGASPSALNRWSAPASPGPVELWVVLRDGRGGVGYAARRFNVE